MNKDHYPSRGDIRLHNRANQIILLASFIPLCWLGFMAVHELGHWLAGILSGGTVQKVVLHPLSISRTDVSPNPYPLVVAWAGPLIGTVLPVVAWGILARRSNRFAFMARFFAGFCLIANGGYLAFGAGEKIGDAGTLLKLGAPIWLLWLFGALVPAGIGLWHNQGKHFGFGKPANEVDEYAAYLSLGLATALFVATALLSPRF